MINVDCIKHVHITMYDILGVIERSIASLMVVSIIYFPLCLEHHQELQRYRAMCLTFHRIDGKLSKE